MIQLPFWKRWYVQSVVPLCVSLVVIPGTYLLSETPTLKESIARVFGIWVIGMIFQIAYSLHSFHVDRLENKHVLDVITKIDYLLLELQSRFREIAARTLSGRPNRVFIDYYRRSLEDSLKVARRAAQRGELEVRDHHFATVEIVLAAFEGCQDRTFRCAWLIEQGEDLFDKYWREYMKSLVKLSGKSKNKRVQVRILFVSEKQEHLELPAVKTILSFISAKKGFEYHLMSRSDYEYRLCDRNLDNQYLDFGVYGDHLLFRTISYNPNIGVFSDDQTAIDAYRGMHDDAMSATETLKTPAGLPTDVSLEQFLNCDNANTAFEATAEREAEQ